MTMPPTRGGIVVNPRQDQPQNTAAPRQTSTSAVLAPVRADPTTSQRAELHRLGRMLCELARRIADGTLTVEQGLKCSHRLARRIAEVEGHLTELDDCLGGWSA